MLAENMRKGGHLRACGAVELSLDILQQQRNFSRALAAARGSEVGQRQRPDDSARPNGRPSIGMLRTRRAMKIAQLSAAAGEFFTAQTAFQNELGTHDADCWRSYSGYIDSMVATLLEKCSCYCGWHYKAPANNAMATEEDVSQSGARGLGGAAAGKFGEQDQDKTAASAMAEISRNLEVISEPLQRRTCEAGNIAAAVAFLLHTGNLELTCGRGHFPKRGPFLASLALENRILKVVCEELDTNGRVWPLFRRLVHDIIAYIIRFGDRACCFSDVRPFLAWFLPGPAVCRATEGREFRASVSVVVRNAREEARKVVLRHMAGAGSITGVAGSVNSTCANITSRAPLILRSYMCAILAQLAANNAHPWYKHTDKRPSCVDMTVARRRLRRYSVAQELMWYLGGYGSVCRGALARRLVSEYSRAVERGMNATNSGGGQREVQHGDNIIVLTAHVMQHTDEKLRSPARNRRVRSARGERCRVKFASLLDAAALLECGRMNSRFNFQMDVALIEVYSQPQICACRPLVVLFNNLGIKHAQLDSLSYLLMPHALNAGFFTEAATAARNVCRFHRHCAREIPEYVIRALGHENYHKAIEIVRFQRKLHYSHQFAVAWCALIPLVLLEQRYLQSSALAHKFLAEKLSKFPSAFRFGLMAGACTQSKLSDNYDFGVCVTWDCPVGSDIRRAAHEVDNLATGVHRNNARSITLLADWRSRSWSWLCLHGAQGVPKALLCAFERDCSGLSSAIQQISAALCSLQFLPSSLASASPDCVQKYISSAHLTETPLRQLCWYLGISALTATHAALRAVKVTNVGVQGQSTQHTMPSDCHEETSDAVLLPINNVGDAGAFRAWGHAGDAFSYVASIFEQVGRVIAAGITTCVRACDPHYLIATSEMLYQGGLWACITTAICTRIVPPMRAKRRLGKVSCAEEKVSARCWEDDSFYDAQRSLKLQVKNGRCAWQAIIRSIRAAINILDGPLPVVSPPSPIMSLRGGQCWDGAMPVRYFKGVASCLPPMARSFARHRAIKLARRNRVDIWKNIRRSHCESYKRMLAVLKAQRALLNQAMASFS